MQYKNAQSTHVKKVITLLCITLLTLGILFMACGAFAQNTVYIGPYLGIGNQQSYNPDFYHDPAVKTSNLPGATFGIAVQDSMNSNITLGFGLGYSAYNTTAQYTDKTAEGNPITGSYYDSYGFVTAPVTLMIKSRTSTSNKIGFYAEFQLAPCINTFAAQKQTLSGSTLTLDTAVCTLTNVKDQTRPFNVMFGVSGGFIIPMNNLMIQIGPYYSTSLADIKRPPFYNYTTVSGAQEAYTPTTMRAMGAKVTIAIKINRPKKQIATTTSAADAVKK